MDDTQSRYSNATKATWRGWAWNQVASRVPRGSTVMVLCGDTAADEFEARKRGLYCIGVDVKQDCIEAFRESGGIAVKDKVHRQIGMIKPEAVILDFMGGITPMSYGTCMYAAITCRCIVANFLRGRDRQGSDICDAVGDCMTVEYVKNRVKHTRINRHRGKAFWFNEWTNCANSHGIVKTEEVQEVCNKMLRQMKPCFYSYPSKDSPGLYYDSFAVSSELLSTSEGIQWADIRRVKASKRKAAAAKALLTMKKQKVLDKYKPFVMN